MVLNARASAWDNFVDRMWAALVYRSASIFENCFTSTLIRSRESTVPSSWESCSKSSGVKYQNWEAQAVQEVGYKIQDQYTSKSLLQPQILHVCQITTSISSQHPTPVSSSIIHAPAPLILSTKQHAR